MEKLLQDLKGLEEVYSSFESSTSWTSEEMHGERCCLKGTSEAIKMYDLHKKWGFSKEHTNFSSERGEPTT